MQIKQHRHYRHCTENAVMMRNKSGTLIILLKSYQSCDERCRYKQFEIRNSSSLRILNRGCESLHGYIQLIMCTVCPLGRAATVILVTAFSTLIHSTLYMHGGSLYMLRTNTMRHVLIGIWLIILSRAVRFAFCYWLVLLSALWLV